MTAPPPHGSAVDFKHAEAGKTYILFMRLANPQYMKVKIPPHGSEAHMYTPAGTNGAFRLVVIPGLNAWKKPGQWKRDEDMDNSAIFVNAKYAADNNLAELYELPAEGGKRRKTRRKNKTRRHRTRKH